MKLALAAVLALVACQSDHTGRDVHRRSHPESRMIGVLPHHMRNCPSGVAGAGTVSAPTPDGVDVTITSTDATARRDILVRAALQSWQRDPVGLASEHTGDHTGPGTLGRCPIIHAATTITYQPIPDGVRIHVAARRASDVPALQRATEARVRALELPSS
ncbi:MAG TPA: hypothetical protein VGF94_27230 [Kofleriaceae bacterium]|jgi:hypothetical protein